MNNIVNHEMMMDEDMEHITRHRRRHTIARPISALGLISDSSASEDEDEDDHQFDRISDILSTLIQEANEAVNCEHSIEIPVIRKLSNAPSEQKYKKPASLIQRTSSAPVMMRRRRSSPSTALVTTHSKIRKHSVLVESFKRLDNSMAMIDSLSRDLVPNTTTVNIPQKTFMKMKPAFDPRLSALLLLPLLHVPHALISMVFDSISSTPNRNHSFGGLVVWAFLFAITNLLVVDNSVNMVSTSNKVLPGTFSQKTSKNRKRPNNFYGMSRKLIQQRKRIAAHRAIMQQQPFLAERKTILSRRNSL